MAADHSWGRPTSGLLAMDDSSLEYPVKTMEVDQDVLPSGEDTGSVVTSVHLQDHMKTSKQGEVATLRR